MAAAASRDPRRLLPQHHQSPEGSPDRALPREVREGGREGGVRNCGWKREVGARPWKIVTLGNAVGCRRLVGVRPWEIPEENAASAARGC